MALPDTYKPVPVETAKAIAEHFEKNWVVILAADVAHGHLHTTTYGRSPEEKVYAAKAGEYCAKCLGHELPASTFFEDFRAVPAAQARADLEESQRKVAELEAELHQTQCRLAEHEVTDWPRIRDLPEAEREPFRKRLDGQTRPLINSLAYEEQDAYYPEDYKRWKAGKPVID